MPITNAAGAGHQSRHKYSFKKYINGRWRYYYDTNSSKHGRRQVSTNKASWFWKLDQNLADKHKTTKHYVTKQRAGESLGKKIKRVTHTPLIYETSHMSIKDAHGGSTISDTTTTRAARNSAVNKAWKKVGKAYDRGERAISKIRNKLPWGKRRSKASYKVNFKRSRTQSRR